MPFSYASKKGGKPVSDILSDGWKFLAPPKKEKQFWVWWFAKDF